MLICTYTHIHIYTHIYSLGFREGESSREYGTEGESLSSSSQLCADILRPSPVLPTHLHHYHLGIELVYTQAYLLRILFTYNQPLPQDSHPRNVCQLVYGSLVINNC